MLPKMEPLCTKNIAPELTIKSKESFISELAENEKTFENDIANYLGKIKSMKSHERVELARSIWRPPKGYVFPKGAKKSDCCKASWLEKYEWLVYSPKLNSIFCLYCLVVDEPGRESLVTSGLNFWHSATSKLKKHSQKKHDEFQRLFSAVVDPSKSIDNMANRIMSNLVKKNRILIRPMVACIEFLGKNNVALRGRRDDSKYYLSDETGEKSMILFQ